MYAKVEQPALNRFLIDQLSCFVSQIPSLPVKARATEEKAIATTVKQRIEPNKNSGARRKLVVVRTASGGTCNNHSKKSTLKEEAFNSIDCWRWWDVVDEEKGGRKLGITNCISSSKADNDDDDDRGDDGAL